MTQKVMTQKMVKKTRTLKVHRRAAEDSAGASTIACPLAPAHTLLQENMGGPAGVRLYAVPGSSSQGDTEKVEVWLRCRAEVQSCLVQKLWEKAADHTAPGRMSRKATGSLQGEGLLLVRAFDLGAFVKPADHNLLSSMWAPATQPKEDLMHEHITLESSIHEYKKVTKGSEDPSYQPVKQQLLHKEKTTSNKLSHLSN
ncbi:hypothetical protein EK904_004965 [Melospiza melodia maxima]|nr:hypothetical protein EK904_004965 [Melospiza melodia maxima]